MCFIKLTSNCKKQPALNKLSRICRWSCQHQGGAVLEDQEQVIQDQGGAVLDTSQVEQDGQKIDGHEDQLREYLGQSEEGFRNEETQEETTDYVLSRDRIRRQFMLPSRFVNADLIAFALNVANQLELDGPATYMEAIRSKD